jgi:hypothetical protein
MTFLYANDDALIAFHSLFLLYRLLRLVDKMAARVLGKESGGSDSRFFTTQKKGEMHELRLELHSTDRTVKVDAVKKVIASMTVGKDVSMLFTDVLNCVQTGNIGES